MRSYRASASASASRSLARSSHAASASSDASTMSASWASAAASAAMSASVSPFFIIRRPSTSFALPSARRRSRSASAYSADASHARWHAAFFSRTAVTSAQCSRWMSRQRHAALYAESFAIFDASVALSHPCARGRGGQGGARTSRVAVGRDGGERSGCAQKPRVRSGPHLQGSRVDPWLGRRPAFEELGHRIASSEDVWRRLDCAGHGHGLDRGADLRCHRESKGPRPPH
mmetsp:Transcript_18067/g.47565  ORF Transcript_18067/g.47565 Transcript_18067/m.47565 type:complete len:231 (-) Transcript_18067:98-790(-)